MFSADQSNGGVTECRQNGSNLVSNYSDMVFIMNYMSNTVTYFCRNLLHYNRPARLKDWSVTMLNLEETRKIAHDCR